jgi:hypothetical protein
MVVPDLRGSRGIDGTGNGNFVFSDLQEGLVEVTPGGDVVARLPQAPERRIHHDVLGTADETLLFLATDAREVGGVTIVGEAIWAWRPGSEAEMKWSAFDHLSPGPPDHHGIRIRTRGDCTRIPHGCGSADRHPERRGSEE